MQAQDPEAGLRDSLTALRTAVVRKMLELVEKGEGGIAALEAARKLLNDQNVVLPPDPYGTAGLPRRDVPVTVDLPFHDPDIDSIP